MARLLRSLGEALAIVPLTPLQEKTFVASYTARGGGSTDAELLRLIWEDDFVTKLASGARVSDNEDELIAEIGDEPRVTVRVGVGDAANEEADEARCPLGCKSWCCGRCWCLIPCSSAASGSWEALEGQSPAPSGHFATTPRRLVNLLDDDSFSGPVFPGSLTPRSPRRKPQCCIGTPSTSSRPRSPERSMCLTPSWEVSSSASVMSIATPEKGQAAQDSPGSSPSCSETEMELMLDLANHVPCNMMDRITGVLNFTPKAHIMSSTEEEDETETDAEEEDAAVSESNLPQEDAPLIHVQPYPCWLCRRAVAFLVMVATLWIIFTAGFVAGRSWDAHSSTGRPYLLLRELKQSDAASKVSNSWSELEPGKPGISLATMNVTARRPDAPGLDFPTNASGASGSYRWHRAEVPKEWFKFEEVARWKLHVLAEEPKHEVKVLPHSQTLSILSPPSQVKRWVASRLQNLSRSRLQLGKLHSSHPEELRQGNQDALSKHTGRLLSPTAHASNTQGNSSEGLSQGVIRNANAGDVGTSGALSRHELEKHCLDAVANWRAGGLDAQASNGELFAELACHASVLGARRSAGRRTD